MIFIEIYRNLFYRFYSFHVWLNGGKYGPHDSAYLFLGVLIMFNIFTILMVFQILTGIVILAFLIKYQLIFAVSMLVLTEILGYFLIRRNKEYLKIIKKFKKESEAERKKYSKFAIVYAVATFLIWILSVITSTA